LFLSSYFKKYQKLYYEKLSGYHNGEIEDWIEFFIDGVIEVAEEAIMIVEKITKLKEKDFAKIQAFGKRASESAVAVLPKLYAHPIVNVALIRKWTGFSAP
jgi:Fic family protein